MMSAVDDEADMCCAACGIKQLDNIKLKNCTACHLVKYCSVECQKNHRKQHKKECKKRMAELRDELLFKQPESSHFGDCPICFVPLSIDINMSALSSCCGVFICDGCSYANQMKDARSKRDPVCPFCRQPYASSNAEAERNAMKLFKAGNLTAIRQKGCEAKIVHNYGRAMELLTKAANMGDAVAHCELANMYGFGGGVEKDTKKAVYHWEEAAIRGNPEARFNLGIYEAQNCKFDRAVKHWIIAASQGYDLALEKLKEWYHMGTVRKEDLTSALRAHQAAIDSTKSPQREEAATADRSC